MSLVTILESTPVSYIGSTKRQLDRRVVEHAAVFDLTFKAYGSAESPLFLQNSWKISIICRENRALLKIWLCLNLLLINLEIYIGDVNLLWNFHIYVNIKHYIICTDDDSSDLFLETAEIVKYTLSKTGLTDENLHTREICGHRVSGYYTSSLPSVAEIQRTSLTVPHSFCDAENHSNRDSFSVDPSLTFNESLVRARNLRKQSDLQKLRTVTEKYNELKKIVIMQVENYKKIKDYINDKEMADIFVERKERENAMIVHVREDTDLNIDEVRNYITTDAPNVKKDQFSLRKMGKEGSKRRP
ncbi:hypothetical protein GQR58_016536 [Nymphon striatum]|nr:hypothetical protein GQR58_016536 [Nymphon striatum]